MNKVAETTELLESLKVEDIVCIEVKDVSSLFDQMIVGTVFSNQHAKTVAEKIQYHFKPEFSEIPSADGKEFGEWVAIDLGDIVVHVMTKESREKYSIEELWKTFKNRTNETDD